MLNDWRKSSVNPIFNKGKNEDMINSSSVSLTSTLEKVMEQILLEVITKHIEEQNVMRSSQHEFTKGKSHLNNLIAFCDGKAGWVDRGRAVDVVYLEFSKAFTLSPITSS